MANTTASIRQEMMQVIVSQVDGYLRGNNSIVCYDGTTVLCRIGYTGIVQDGSSTLASYIFQDSTNTTAPDVLKGDVIAAGTADSFKIFKYGMSEIDDNIVVQGTIGVIGSNADLQFNTTDWILEDAVTISQLTIQLPNG